MLFTDEQPFLDAIFARYHDDGPRLLYADFLDDIGEPARAELVRVQLTLARIPDDHPRRPELADREAELLNTHRARWTAHLADLDVAVGFRRGIPDSFSMHAGRLLSDGDELFRIARVRRLRLLEAACVMPKLVHSPLLAMVRELDLCANELGNGGLNLLSRSQHLRDTESLDIGLTGIDDAGVRVLARSGSLVNLTALALNDNEHITADGLKALAESPFFVGLESLDVSGNDIGDAGMKAITTGGAFPRLHTLRLRDNHIGDAGVEILARSSLLVRMLNHSPHLELRENAIGPAGVAALAASSALARCTMLDLSGNYLGDRGLATLAASPHLGRLHTLRIAGNQITDAGVAAAYEHLPHMLAQLRLLDLSSNRLTRHGIGMFHTAAAQGESEVILDVSNNVQTCREGEVPIQLGQVVSGVLEEVTEAAALRRRIAHPRTLPPEAGS